MIIYRCDGCGRAMREGELRYIVSIDVRAAYDEIQIGLADLVRDHRQEILALLDRLKDRDPSELEEQVYKKMQRDLCPACHRAYIRDPLRFHPEQGKLEDAPVDIDAFLRSLGFGRGKGGEV